MINIADHPAVQAQLERDAAAVGQHLAGNAAEADATSAAPVSFNVADLPAVKAELERVTANTQNEQQPAIEYARAPIASGPQCLGNRPPATQGSAR